MEHDTNKVTKLDVDAIFTPNLNDMYQYYSTKNNTNYNKTFGAFIDFENISIDFDSLQYIQSMQTSNQASNDINQTFDEHFQNKIQSINVYDFAFTKYYQSQFIHDVMYLIVRSRCIKIIIIMQHVSKMAINDELAILHLYLNIVSVLLRVNQSFICLTCWINSQ